MRRLIMHFSPANGRLSRLDWRAETLSEDLVQDALLAALKSAHTFKGDSKESTWLVGDLRHKILDHF